MDVSHAENSVVPISVQAATGGEPRVLHDVTRLLLSKTEEAPNRHLQSRSVTQVQDAKSSFVPVEEATNERGV
jgi:hypothetical protein